MKKYLNIIAIMLLSFILFGCSTNTRPDNKVIPENKVIPDNKGIPNDKVVPEINPKPTEPTENQFQPSLGGITLGSSKDKVLQAFGTTYKETVYEDELSLGEPFSKIAFNNGVLVVLGSKSNKVLEIETNSPATITNLGFKVGDKAQDVLKTYRSKYKEPTSRHSNDILVGWFLVRDQELVIFNFTKGEELVNTDVKPDARIERIKLTNFDYID